MAREKIGKKPASALYQAEFAERIGVRERTLSSWRQRGLPRANPVPPPDGREPDRGYLRPWWLLATVDAWHGRRERVTRRDDSA